MLYSLYLEHFLNSDYLKFASFSMFMFTLTHFVTILINMPFVCTSIRVDTGTKCSYLSAYKQTILCTLLVLSRVSTFSYCLI